MEGLSRLVSVPMMRAWVALKGGEIDRIPRPRDRPESHSEGIDNDRILIFGGGPAVGWGVLSHDIGLPGALSRALSHRTRRGADVYVVAIPRLRIADALDQLHGVRLHEYNAVVLTLGVNDAGAMTSLTTWERDLTSVLEEISRRMSPRGRMFVAGVHPIRSIPLFDSSLGSVADNHARKLNLVSAQVCDRLPRVTFIPLTAPEPIEPLRFRDGTSYRHWGGELADGMAPQLDYERRSSALAYRPRADGWNLHNATTSGESIRSKPRHDDENSQFDNIISMARASFGVRSATVSVIDSGRVVHRAQVGDVPQRILLDASFTAHVIRLQNGIVVPDATVDERFRNLPHVFGYPRIRFYAGFALERSDGTRVGTLNVFDPAPRLAAEDWRASRLRQLAMLAQTELQKM